MHQTSSTRPAVTVETVVTETGDITHCRITVDTSTFDALLTQGSSELEEMILDATDVELTTDEVMTVTRASRKQMERESDRLKEVLQKMPAGTVALVDGGMYFWLNAKGDLLWAECMTIGGDAKEIFPGYIQDVGEIDTEELYAVAEGIRNWLLEPKTEAVDIGWLRDVDGKIDTAQ